MTWQLCATEGCGGEAFADSNCIKVVCSNCVMKMTMSLLSEKERDKVFGLTTQRKAPFPRGWKWMNEFVDESGNVYHKGAEQKKLKGTRPFTDILAMKARQKANKEKRKLAEQKKLLKMAAEKKELKKAIKKQQDFLDHKVKGK